IRGNQCLSDGSCGAHSRSFRPECRYCRGHRQVRIQRGTPMSEAPLDDLDYRIIELLGRDARVSNRQIAAGLGVTEGTIRTRIKALQDQQLIQFTVVTDFRLAGSPNLVMMGIHADPGRVPVLAEELSRLPEIGAVVVLLGRYNLLATGLFTSLMDVN